MAEAIAKRGRGPGLGNLLKIWSFLFNIYTVAEASDFKFGTQLGFANAYHKITPIGKSGCGYWSSQKFWGSPIIFLATSKLACNCGLPRLTIKPQPEEQWAWPWAREAP